MKKNLGFFLILLLSLAEASSAQIPHWTIYEIPGDSLRPACLTFSDSLHGYLGVVKNFKVYSLETRLFFFETTNGGRSWFEVKDTTMVGSASDTNQVWECLLEPTSPIIYGWTLKERYYYNRMTPGTGSVGALVHSVDGGITWSVPFRTPPINGTTLFPLCSFGKNNLLSYEVEKGMLVQSFDGGATYPKLFDDSVYFHTIFHVQMDSNYAGFGNLSNDYGSSLSFDISDAKHWTVAPCRGFQQLLNPPLHPMGLQTIITDDAGKTWKPYLTVIPGEDPKNRISGVLQFIKGTPNLYYFTGEPEGWREYGSYHSIRDLDASFGINFLYSTNYGASWEFHNEYSDRRRAFETVKDKELWITARPSNSTQTSDEATTIAHTTDNGATWEEDTKTLANDIPYDGRILTFSDPSHGWLAVTKHGKPGSGDAIVGCKTYIFRYDASEQPKNSVEDQGELIQKKSYKIFPNPSSDEVHLQLPANSGIKKVEFYDLLGIQRFPIYHLESNIVRVEVKDLLQGTYIARLSYLMDGLNGSFTFPFLVQH